MAAILGIVGMVVSAVGTIAQAGAMRTAAEAERQAAEYKAREEERLAMMKRATAQREALDKRREGRMALSSLQARSAASGGGADDPTVINLGAGIAGESEYNALTAMWSGEAAAVGLENQAAIDRYAGEMRARALQAKANATLIGGFGGLATGLEKYLPRFG